MRPRAAQGGHRTPPPLEERIRRACAPYVQVRVSAQTTPMRVHTVLVWMSHGYNVDAAVFDALTNSYLNGHTTVIHSLTRAAQHRRAGG